MTQTPLELLTIIAAPALITNASSVLILSTSNRFARAVDRSRALAAELGKAGEDHPAHLLLGRLHRIARRRTLLVVRALTSFYVAVGSFAFGTFSGLLGTGLEHFGYDGIAFAFTGLALGVVAIGTLAIATGAVMLVVESRITVRSLTIEAQQ